MRASVVSIRQNFRTAPFEAAIYVEGTEFSWVVTQNGDCISPQSLRHLTYVPEHGAFTVPDIIIQQPEPR